MYEIILTVVMSMLDIPRYRYDSERSFPTKRAGFANFFRFCQPKRVPALNIAREYRPGCGGLLAMSLRSFVFIGRGQVRDDWTAAYLCSTKWKTGCVHPVNYEHGYETITVFDEKVAHTMQPHSI